jgi:hypothetical protein
MMYEAHVLGKADFALTCYFGHFLTAQLDECSSNSIMIDQPPRILENLIEGRDPREFSPQDHIHKI